ncbi:MAG: hypothetical protein EBV03_13690, partial [Proteobacteria bacterium]|nr:hypothetical protein [Pseudomonadota bacterium]
SAFAADGKPAACSKGHAVPVFYAALHQIGVISEQDLLSLRQFDSVFEGHPTPRFVHNEAATGSLGQGLSIGLGMAINAQRNKLGYKTYVVLGDGECAEGSVWEAAELAGVHEFARLPGLSHLGECLANRDHPDHQLPCAEMGRRAAGSAWRAALGGRLW